MSEERTEPPRTHPDRMAQRLLWRPSATIRSTTPRANLIRVCADACGACGGTGWTIRTRKAGTRERLAVPEPVCLDCGAPWDVSEEPETAPQPRGGTVSSRGRWTHQVHVRASRPAPRTSAEERLFGDVDLSALSTLRRLCGAMYSHRAHKWGARVYFPYATHFGVRRGRGGMRAALRWAAAEYPRAPFAWRLERVADLIAQGRAEWARRLAESRLIEGGTWWQSDARQK